MEKRSLVQARTYVDKTDKVFFLANSEGLYENHPLTLNLKMMNCYQHRKSRKLDFATMEMTCLPINYIKSY